MCRCWRCAGMRQIVLLKQSGPSAARCSLTPCMLRRLQRKWRSCESRWVLTPALVGWGVRGWGWGVGGRWAHSRAVQAIRWERSLQDERQQLQAAREEAGVAAQKHVDAMRQMGNRLAAAAEAAAAAELRAQACEREAAARALQDESIMRGGEDAACCTACLLRTT
jgi:hypothetical protein